MSERALAPVETPPVTTMPAAFEREWRTMKEQAAMLVASGLLPKHVTKPETAVAIMLMGEELGFQRMQSFRMIQVINGTPSLNAAGMAAVVQAWISRHGGLLQVTETTDTSCTVLFRRPEWREPQASTFSIHDAARANLNTPTWKAHPRNMLYARAVSNACRMGWPEVIGGIYDPDEVAHFTAGAAERPTRVAASVEPSRDDDWGPGTGGRNGTGVKHLYDDLTDRARAANADRDQGAWLALVNEVGKDVDLWPALIAESPSETHLAWLERAANGKGQALKAHFDKRRGELSATVEAGDVDDNTLPDDDGAEYDPDTGERIPDWVGREQVAEPAEMPGMPKRGRRADQIAGMD